MNQIWFRSIGIHQPDLAKITRGVWDRSGPDPEGFVNQIEFRSLGEREPAPVQIPGEWAAPVHNIILCTPLPHKFTATATRLPPPPITRARIADELYGTRAKMSIVNPATITDAELPSPQGKPLTKILYTGSIISLVWILQGGREVDHQGKGGCSSGGGGGGGYKVHLPPGVPPHKRNKCSPVHSMTFFFCRGATPQAIECIIGEHGLYDVITHFDI